MEYKPPKEIRDMTFLSKKAGSFSGVPQRTVQTWTEKGLIISETEGTGDRRQYTVLNCIEIKLIKELANDRISFDIISEIMGEIRKGTPLTLKEALADGEAYLVFRWYKSGGRGITCISKKRYGSRSGIKGEKKSFQKFWSDTTRPDDPEFKKTWLYNLTYFANEVLEKIK